MVENKYIDFRTAVCGEKTTIYVVVSKRSGAMLGGIRWYAPWRQYCFWPTADTVFNSGCLASIKEFLEEKNAEHKKTKEREVKKDG